MHYPLAVMLACTAACGSAPERVPAPDSAPVSDATPTPDATPEPEVAEPAPPPDTRPEVASDSTCLPAWFEASETDEEADPPGPQPALTLGRVGDGVVLCAIDTNRAHLAGPLGCWDIDLTSGALQGRPAAPLPGQGFPVILEKGCARGYCLPATAPRTGEALIATSTDGQHTVVVTLAEIRSHVFETASRRHLREIPNHLESDPEDAPLGISNAPVGLAYVRDTFYVAGSDAGPFIGVWAFRDDGTRLGPLVDTPAAGADEVHERVSVYGGGMSVLDDDHVAFNLRGLDRLRSIGSDGRTTTLVRKTPKNPCREHEMGLMEPDDERSRCARHLAKHFLPWSDAALVKSPAGGFVAVQPSGRLVFLNEALREKRRTALKYCR